MKVKQGENKMITDDEKKLAKKTGTMVETTKKIETSEESIDAEKVHVLLFGNDIPWDHIHVSSVVCVIVVGSPSES